MYGDLVKIRLTVESLQAEVVKALNPDVIAEAISIAAEKAVAQFDFEQCAKEAFHEAMYAAKRKATQQLTDICSDAIYKKVMEKLTEKPESEAGNE